MAIVGGRSNSGEGGENPYYFIDGTRATTKQVASGRFGVTAEYLVSGREIEIKMAQGAKPGEGGQLMGIKVDTSIARARHSSPGVDLISPPPLHDIYSIEDLKELIYELRQLHPETQICVKLVAGSNIGNIAVGVVKAGADVIQISGGSGGTGAASLSSMMHAGLPWELGLVDVHQTLIENGLRDRVTLRVDGGLHSGMDLIVATLLGAEEYGFGKLLLVAQGCIMARICEKNRCPRGIATHDPKFKAKYRGSPKDITVLQTLAEDVRGHLATMGVRRLEDILGQANVYLRPQAEHDELIKKYQLDLTFFLHGSAKRAVVLDESVDRAPVVSELNREITDLIVPRLSNDSVILETFPIRSTDRAIPATLSGVLAKQSHTLRMDALDGSAQYGEFGLEDEKINLTFEGSAGQGFAAFTVAGMAIRLLGEANDSVAKSMSGGQVVITPSPEATFVPEKQVIIGNCALYGATGGTVMIHGIAGDRFAVRNSGAKAIVEGAGLHLCEYMTSGMVVVLGEVSHNVGAGMTGIAGDRFAVRNSGAKAIVPASQVVTQDQHLPGIYCTWRPLEESERDTVRAFIASYVDKTQSISGQSYLTNETHLEQLVCCLSHRDAVALKTPIEGVA